MCVWHYSCVFYSQLTSPSRSPTPGSWKPSRPVLFWVRWFVSKREALMPQCCLLFTQHIRYGFTLPWCWYQLGVNVHGFFLLVRAFVCIRVCVWVCVCFYAIRAPRSKGMALWWVYQTKNFMPISWVLASSQLTSSFAPSAHHVHIYIGVWCRYRS